MAHVVDIPLQEVRDLLDRGAEREAVSKLGNVKSRARVLHAERSWTTASLLTPYGPCRLALLVAGNTVWDLLLQANLLLIHAIARPPTLSLITGMECDKPAPPDT